MADRQIKAIVRSLEALTERAIKKITLDVTANLKEVTPRDTGWAAANWVPSIGASIEGGAANPNPTEQDASSAEARSSSALAAVAAGYRLKQGRVFISNNVPYIIQLNDGSSKKEPAGFVQRAIAKAVTVDIKGFRG